MSDQSVHCPKCKYEYPYQDGANWVCSDCGHTWDPNAVAASSDENVQAVSIIKDANGNELKDGDTVTVIKDLKVKGASSSVKVGTKVKNIRLVHDSSDGHDIACNIPGFGAMGLKSEFVKKV